MNDKALRHLDSFGAGSLQSTEANTSATLSNSLPVQGHFNKSAGLFGGNNLGQMIIGTNLKPGLKMAGQRPSIFTSNPTPSDNDNFSSG